ncbi:MAG: hypothetical protein ACRECE_11785, partial [Xanthobacteraceae bacterium]
MRPAAASNERMAPWLRSASPTAERAISSSRVDCRPISSIELDNSSVAVTVASIRRAVSADSEDAAAIRSRVSPAACCSVMQTRVNEPDVSLIASTTSPIALPKSAMASSMALRRTSMAFSARSRCSVIALATSKPMTCDTILPHLATR